MAPKSALKKTKTCRQKRHVHWSHDEDEVFEFNKDEAPSEYRVHRAAPPLPQQNMPNPSQPFAPDAVLKRVSSKRENLCVIPSPLPSTPSKSTPPETVNGNNNNGGNSPIFKIVAAGTGIVGTILLTIYYLKKQASDVCWKKLCPKWFKKKQAKLKIIQD